MHFFNNTWISYNEISLYHEILVTTSRGNWGSSYGPTFNGNGDGVYMASSLLEEASPIYAHAMLTVGCSQYHHANREYPLLRPANVIKLRHRTSKKNHE